VDGCEVGRDEGFEAGCIDGSEVGCDVGCDEGLFDGCVDGDDDG
jgi:hypothetical protein